jgi:hypothetical protein
LKGKLSSENKGATFPLVDQTEKMTPARNTALQETDVDSVCRLDLSLLDS